MLNPLTKAFKGSLASNLMSSGWEPVVKGALTVVTAYLALTLVDITILPRLEAFGNRAVGID
jgi:hypothetical protein